jgi:pilus assembly protein CpaF
LKANVHRKLLNRLNLETLASADRSRAESEIRTVVFELISEEGTPLSMTEREVILSDIVDEVFGLGPLEPLLRDPTISDILVNTYKNVYVERHGKLEKAATSFPGRQAPAARDRPHRQRRRPPRG